MLSVTKPPDTAHRKRGISPWVGVGCVWIGLAAIVSIGLGLIGQVSERKERAGRPVESAALLREQAAVRTAAPSPRIIDMWTGYGIPDTWTLNEKDADWYRRAADLGDAAAQFEVGLMYELCLGGLSQDLNASLDWYYRATDSAVWTDLPSDLPDQQVRHSTRLAVGRLHHYLDLPRPDDATAAWMYDFFSRSESRDREWLACD